MQGCIDSYKQFMNIKKHMRDEKTGLYGGIAYLTGILAGLCLQGLSVDKQSFFGRLDGAHYAVTHYFDAVEYVFQKNIV